MENRDPAFIRKFKKQYCEEVFVEHAVTKKKKKLWKRKDQGDFGEWLHFIVLGYICGFIFHGYFVDFYVYF
jgi:hypothetical protein